MHLYDFTLEVMRMILSSCDRAKAEKFSGVDYGTIALTRLKMCGNTALNKLLGDAAYRWRFVADNNASKKAVKGEFRFNCYQVGRNEWSEVNPRLDQYINMEQVEFFILQNWRHFTTKKSDQKLYSLVARLIHTIIDNPPPNLKVFRISVAGSPKSKQLATVLPSIPDIVILLSKCPRLCVIDVDTSSMSIGQTVSANLYNKSNTWDFTESDLISFQIRDRCPSSYRTAAPPIFKLPPHLAILSVNSPQTVEFAIDHCRHLSALFLQSIRVPTHLWSSVPSCIERLHVDRLPPDVYYHMLPKSLRELVCSNIGYAEEFGARNMRVAISGLPITEPKFPENLTTLIMPRSTCMSDEHHANKCLFPKSLTKAILSNVQDVRDRCNYTEGNVIDVINDHERWLHGFTRPSDIGGFGEEFPFQVMFSSNAPLPDYPFADYFSFSNLVVCHTTIIMPMTRGGNNNIISFSGMKVLEELKLHICGSGWSFAMQQALPKSICRCRITTRRAPRLLHLHIGGYPRLSSFAVIVYNLYKIGRPKYRLTSTLTRIPPPIPAVYNVFFLNAPTILTADTFKLPDDFERLLLKYQIIPVTDMEDKPQRMFRVTKSSRYAVQVDYKGLSATASEKLIAAEKHQ